MDVLVEGADNEDLVVVVDWLRPEELFRFLEWALILLNLVCFRVEGETVADPALVPAKNQDFRLTQGERADSVSGRPLVVLYD